MRRSGWWIFSAAVVTVTAAGAYWLGGAQAEGAPTMEPLAYSGTVLEGGVPVSGMRNIGVTLWTDPASTASAARACTTATRAVEVVHGRFRVPLDEECVGAVRRHADLWAQVDVGGTDLPRAHVGAVPYAIEADNGVPAGTIVAYAGETVPRGWLLCDGSALASTRPEFQNLFRAIRTTWGNGSNDADPATDFNIPDLRGRFVRGLDDGSTGRDEDRDGRVASAPGGTTGPRVGSLQGDAFHSHGHTGQTQQESMWSGQGVWYDAPGGGLTGARGADFNLNQAGPAGHRHSHPFTTNSSGGSETRPENAAVLYLIRL